MNKPPIPETEREEQIFKAALNTKHSIPSPETEKFMNNINMEIKYIKEKLDKLPTRAEMDLANEKLVERVLNKCDDRYANKLTQTIVYYLAITILLGVVGIIGKMILDYLSAH